jgi:hypothetical protein
VNDTLLSLLQPLVVAVAAVPELAFVLQLVGLGSAIGGAIALRRPVARRAHITSAWATLGLAVGAVVLAVQAAAAVVL